MHIPKTIINKLIPFLPKYTRKEVLKNAKASIDRQAKKGWLEAACYMNWARVSTTKLSKEDLLTEHIQFLIPQENLEEIGYGNTLEEAAVGFEEEGLEYLSEEEISQSNAEKLKYLAKLAENFPKFKESFKVEDGQVLIYLQLVELKKVIDLAIAVAEASQIDIPIIALSLKSDASLCWQLKDIFSKKSPAYLADGTLMPMRVNRKH